MPISFDHENTPHRLMSRREFMKLSALASAGVLAGCAINPVTGENQFMLVSEDWEIQVDKENAPHQFSSDYGPAQDASLNRYIQQVGTAMIPHTHRPHMPCSFRCVNATYINAYAFPGGSIAATRGIMLSLESEAELAALLGHELGHVNARHTARQMSKGLLTQAIVAGVSVAAATQDQIYGDIAAGIGMVGAGMLLASYSRDNEREADHLGMTYLTRSGYGPDGMVQLMDMLNSMHQGGADAVSLLFSTHPMSKERYDTAVREAGSDFAGFKDKPLYRERYMDNIASLRKIKPAIELFQKGDESVARKKYNEAETALQQGLRLAPADYAGLMIMAKCKVAQEKYGQALEFSELARQAYPQEAQADYVSGFCKLKLKKPDEAVSNFTAYDQKLPGNPNTIFFRGFAYEEMGSQKKAADDYTAYLNQVTEGEQAQYAYDRLVKWGVVKPQPEPEPEPKEKKKKKRNP
ncbi:MAG: M48 family metalloprotease [Thermodesulfobacteriota bacterium]